jgi:hypothetical protein
MRVEKYVSAAGGLPFGDNLGWVATGSEVHHVMSVLERCAAQRIEWGCRQGLQIHYAKTEQALFTCRRGHRKHAQPHLTAKIRVRNKSVWFNVQGKRSLGMWMDTHLAFKEHHIQYTKKDRAPEARLRTLMNTYGVIAECVRASNVACVQAFALCDSEVS